VRYSLVFALLASLIAISPASAQMALIGAGGKTCGDYIAASQDHAIGSSKKSADSRGVLFYSENDR
jgi:hypothetical protein